MNIQIGMIINESFSESLTVDVEIEAYQEFQHTQHCAEHFSADGDEEGTFWEALQYATKTHYEIWERDHEYKDVLKHTEKCIHDRLEEGGFINAWKHGDPLTCEYGELFEPVKITEGILEDVQQCIHDAAFDIAWMKSESLQVYFQTKNPCCWDGRSPQERYGIDWIEDTETRLICMVHNINSDVLERVHEKGHTLTRETSRYGHGRIIEYDTEGSEVW